MGHGIWMVQIRGGMKLLKIPRDFWLIKTHSKTRWVRQNGGIPQWSLALTLRLGYWSYWGSLGITTENWPNFVYGWLSRHVHIRTYVRGTGMCLLKNVGLHNVRLTSSQCSLVLITCHVISHVKISHTVNIYDIIISVHIVVLAGGLEVRWQTILNSYRTEKR